MSAAPRPLSELTDAERNRFASDIAQAKRPGAYGPHPWGERLSTYQAPMWRAREAERIGKLPVVSEHDWIAAIKALVDAPEWEDEPKFIRIYHAGNHCYDVVNGFKPTGACPYPAGPLPEAVAALVGTYDRSAWLRAQNPAPKRYPPWEPTPEQSERAALEAQERKAAEREVEERGRLAGVSEERARRAAAVDEAVSSRLVDLADAIQAGTLNGETAAQRLRQLARRKAQGAKR